MSLVTKELEGDLGQHCGARGTVGTFPACVLATLSQPCLKFQRISSNLAPAAPRGVSLNAYFRCVSLPAFLQRRERKCCWRAKGPQWWLCQCFLSLEVGFFSKSTGDRAGVARDFPVCCVCLVWPRFAPGLPRGPYLLQGASLTFGVSTGRSPLENDLDLHSL